MGALGSDSQDDMAESTKYSEQLIFNSSTDDKTSGNTQGPIRLTTGLMKWNGSAWVRWDGNGMVIGKTVSGAGTNEVLYVDGSGNLAVTSNFQFFDDRYNLVVGTNNSLSNPFYSLSVGGNLLNSSIGGAVFGYAQDSQAISVGGTGSIAGGFQNSGTGNIVSSGTGTFVWGIAPLTSTGDNSFAFGTGFSNTNNSQFMVGWTATPTLQVVNTQVGINNTPSGAALKVIPMTASDVLLFLKGTTSQSGNYLSVQDSSGNAIWNLTSAGEITVSNTTTSPTIFDFDDSRTFTSTIPTGNVAFRIFPTYNYSATAGLGTVYFQGDTGFQDQRTINRTGSLSETVTAWRNSINRTSSFSAVNSSLSCSMTIQGYLTNLVDSGNYNTTAANTSYTQVANLASHSFGITYAGNTRTLTGTISSFKSNFSAAPVLTSGTLNWTYLGFNANATGSTTGTSIGINYYSKISGFDTNWNIFLDNTINSFMGGDAAKTYWGTGTNTPGSATGAIGDASINYDGTNMVINPKEIGSGVVNIPGNVWINTGASLTAGLSLSPLVNTDAALSMKGLASQAGDYLNIVDSTGTAITKITSTGTITPQNTAKLQMYNDSRTFAGTKPTHLQWFLINPSLTSGGVDQSPWSFVSHNLIEASPIDTRHLISDDTDDTDNLINLRMNFVRDTGFYFHQLDVDYTGTATIQAIQNSLGDSGTYGSPNCANFGYTIWGNQITISNNQKFDVNGFTATAVAYGQEIRLQGTPTLTSGTLNFTYYALRNELTGNTVGTSLAFSVYTKMSGYDTNWAIFNDTLVPSFLGGDNSKSYWGTGTNTIGSATGAVGDASIYYDGTNFNINPKEIGSGYLAILGKVGNYNNIVTVSNGIASEVATIDSTGLTANVGASTLYAVPSSGEGLYRVSAYLVTTTAGSVSSTMPNAQVVYTDKDSNTSVTLDVSPILGAAGLGQSGLLTANTVGTVFSGTVVIYAKASTTIQYQTVNYASTAAGMTYALRIKLEAL